MNTAMSIEPAVAGAMMPDAHVSYGLPIGGVPGLDNAVCPDAVGVDIACRMKLSIFEIVRGWACSTRGTDGCTYPRPAVTLQLGENLHIRHNFAWKEMHNGREVIVHQKGCYTGRSRCARGHSRVDGNLGIHRSR